MGAVRPFLRPGVFCGAVIACLALGASGCNERNAFKPPPPPAVTVAQPEVKDVVEWVEFTGSTKATATVELRSRVKGYLQKVNFTDGAFVQKDDLLFLIERAPFEVELESAKASLAKAEAAIQLAKANLERTTTLTKQQAVSRQQFDIDTSELAIAEANERTARASVAQVQLNLDYTEIRAPMAGRIGRHLVDVGNLILADQTTLAVIESIDPIHAYFSVSEQDLLRFMAMLRDKSLPDPEKTPPELFLALLDEDDYSHVGKLDFRELGIDPGTGTTLRRGIFQNAGLELLPGMFVRIRAALGTPSPRVLVEERAISSDQRGDFVLVVNEKNIVEYRPVKLGQKTEGMRVVIDGLKADEWIIVNGLQRARPQSPVTRELASKPGAQPTPSAASEGSSTAQAEHQSAAPQVAEGNGRTATPVPTRK
jgi:RND family efflux transporter MFP subunit